MHAGKEFQAPVSLRSTAPSALITPYAPVTPNVLVDQHIGLEETDDGVCSISFNTVLIATLDERDHIIRG